MIVASKSRSALILVALFALIGCNRTAPSPKNHVPLGWKRIDTDYFSLFVPPSMRGGEEKGTDENGWGYYGDGIHLDIERGPYPAGSDSEVNQPEYREEAAVIDGRGTKIATFQLTGARAANFPGEGKYIAAVYFSNVDGFETSMSMWANCRDVAGQQTAKQIFMTVRLK